MEVTHNYQYDFLAGDGRMADILNLPAGSFEDRVSVPSESQLTYSNGFYVHPSALMIDIRGSSGLPRRHNRPVLAKLYRAYLSEVTAVAASHPDCVNISIRGDGVLGIFDTRDAESVNRLFEVTAQVLSVVDHLNHLLRVRGYSTIRVGAGLDDGDALLVKAGYAGSAISDTVWLGDVVNRATHLSDVAASAVGDERLMVSERFRRLLKPEYRRLLTWTLSRQCFHGNIYWEPFKRWCNANCLPRLQLRLPPALPPILTPPSLLPPIPLPPPSLSDFFRGPPSGLG